MVQKVKFGVVLAIMAQAILFVAKTIIPEFDLIPAQEEALHKAMDGLAAFLGALAIFINPDGTSATKAWEPKGNIFKRIFKG